MKAKIKGQDGRQKKSECQESRLKKTTLKTRRKENSKNKSFEGKKMKDQN